MSEVEGNRKKTGGRKKGTPNKTSGMLKEAILRAAELVGEDGDGKGKTVGYLKMLARSEPKAFAGLLGRVLPLQIGGDPDNPIPVTFQTVYEQRAKG